MRESNFIQISASPTGTSEADLGTTPAIVYTTARDTSHRLAKTGTLSFRQCDQPLESQACVFLDPAKTFQTIVGIGGALTDAAAETFARLPPTRQEELLRAYYHPADGIGYTLARTSIHSCDFSRESYTYVEAHDRDLATFSIGHDEQFRLPLIRRAMAAAGGLTLLASPWSPPAWMKSNASMQNGGTLLAEFRQAWADYFVKFIRAYQRAGIPVWGVTVQNEPMAAQTWESCVFTAEAERDFIKEFLGPTLHQSGLGHIKLIGWDHNRDLIVHRASALLGDPEVAQYLWGLGYHWYETWTGGLMQFANLHRVKEAFPAVNLIFTEGCIERFDYSRLDDWALGERYGHSLVHDFNAGAVAWCDWNILLDETGGPNHAGNCCFAPVIADTGCGELHFTNSYFYLGHFAKFVRPGAQRITSSSSRDALQTTAFLNPDGSLAVIVLNTTDREVDYILWVQGRAAQATSLPHSIATLIF